MVGAVGFEPTLSLVRSECDFPFADAPMVTAEGLQPSSESLEETRSLR
jgi:hypothetical protein